MEVRAARAARKIDREIQDPMRGVLRRNKGRNPKSLKTNKKGRLKRK